MYARVLTAFLLLTASASAATTPDQALTLLNQWRAEAGVPAVQDMIPAWNTGCAHHVTYMEHYGITHFEDNTKPEYTADGDEAGQNSVLASGSGADSPRRFDGAVFHRIGILQPRLQHSGWASENGFLCMREQGGNALSTTQPASVSSYSWPASGATGVPTTFSDNESPDPHVAAGGDPSLGYLISITLDGPWATYGGATSTTTATVTPAGGSPVPITILDSKTSTPTGTGYTFGQFLSNSVVIIPNDPLATGTTYTVSAGGNATGSTNPWSRTWSFTTAGTAPPPTQPTQPVATNSTPASSPFVTPTPTPAAPTAPVASPRVRSALTKLKARRRGRTVTISGTVKAAATGDRVKVTLRRGVRTTTKSLTVTVGRAFRVALLAPKGHGKIKVSLTLVPKDPKRSTPLSTTLGSV